MDISWKQCMVYNPIELMHFLNKIKNRMHERSVGLCGGMLSKHAVVGSRDGIMSTVLQNNTYAWARGPLALHKLHALKNRGGTEACRYRLYILINY
jgi:hypothetical protein